MTNPHPGATRQRPTLIATAIVAVVALVGALLGIGVRSTYGGQVAVDEPQYLLSALSLFEDRNLDIADELAAERYRAFSSSAIPVQTEKGPDGRQLSPHDPLLAVLLAVPMGLGGWVAAKVVLAVLAALTAAMLLHLAVRRFDVPIPLATAGVSIAAATAPLAVYGQQLYPELPAALVVLVGVWAVMGPLRAPGVVLLGTAVVALPWLSIKYGPVAAALAVLGLWRLVRSGGRRAAAMFATVLALAGATYLLVHRLVWGGWTVYAAGDHFAATGEFAVVGVDPDYPGRSLRLIGLLVDRDFGLASWQPAYLLAIPALVALLRRRPAGHLALLVPLLAGWLTATFVALTMHGFWWPGRQVVVVLPLLVVAVLWWLSITAPVWRWVAAALSVAGLLAYVALLADGWAGQLTWVVGFEAVDEPLHQAWRLLLPDYRSGGASLWVRHACWLLAAAGLAVLGWRSVTSRMSTGPPDRFSPSTTPSVPTNALEGTRS